MKKKMIALLAGALMTLSASSAFAAFGNLDLIRVVFEKPATGTTEIGTRLTSVDVKNIATTTVSANPFTDLNTTASFANLYVAYIAVNNTATSKELWVSGDGVGPIVAPAISAGKSGTISGILSSMYTAYGITATTPDSVKILNSNANGYNTKANTSVASYFGSLNNSITTATRSYTNASLAALATGGSVTQDLYYFGNYAAASTGVKVASITTFADGTTQVAAPVPLPAAAYLLGSGLLGLVGIRRKMNK